MKIINTICLFVLAPAFAFCQTLTVSGTVVNQKGQPVPFAFVRDAQHNYATYADSTGAFSLKVDPSSSLAVIAGNYKDITVKIENKTSIKVVMPGESTEDASARIKRTNDERISLKSFLQNRNELLDQSGTIIKSGYEVEPTRGSQYLFDDWLPGFGISKDDLLIAEPANLYNYDKITGYIMYTRDGKSLEGVSPDQMKVFTLYDRKGRGHMYENTPLIKDKPFVEVLVSTTKYKVYKKVDTKLNRADFHTDGVLVSGHKYDEYVDAVHYYMLTQPDGKLQSFTLKKNAIKKAFGGEADSFIAAQGSREVDERYVMELGNSLSK